ncbi:hypothetical protein ACWDOP_00285 [Nocardia sp. NPDC003693]
MTQETVRPMETGAAVDNLIRLAEGASLMRMNPRTLRRWIAQGKLTGWRMPSNHIHVSRDEVLGLAKLMQVEADARPAPKGAAR